MPPKIEFFDPNMASQYDTNTIETKNLLEEKMEGQKLEGKIEKNQQNSAKNNKQIIEPVCSLNIGAYKRAKMLWLLRVGWLLVEFSHIFCMNCWWKLFQEKSRMNGWCEMKPQTMFEAKHRYNKWRKKMEKLWKNKENVYRFWW